MPSIRIISTPPGFADQDIREAWVGLVIPLPTEEEIAIDPPSTTSFGNENKGGYVVMTHAAVAALREAGQVRAAVFWERFMFGSYLRFKKEVCDLIE